MRFSSDIFVPKTQKDIKYAEQCKIAYLLVKEYFVKVRKLQTTPELRFIKGRKKEFTGLAVTTAFLEIRSRDIFLLVNKTTSEYDIIQTIATLCHEMIHYEQILQGRLVPCKESRGFVWADDNTRNDKISYWDAPWEKEARSLEYELAEKVWAYNLDLLNAREIISSARIDKLKELFKSYKDRHQFIEV